MAKTILNVGIDLGTTNTVCYVYSDVSQQPELQYLHGSLTGIYPSIVYYDKEKKQFIVGDEIKNNYDLYLDSFHNMKVKLSMGEQYTESYNGMSLNPKTFSAEVLKYIYTGLLKIYEDLEIANLVITVPAYFKNNERRMIIEASELAGFHPTGEIRLINEPTAAALAYGEELQNAQSILAYDLGGGTFDVSLLEYDNIDEIRFYQAVRTDGMELGGRNFDELISNYLYQEFIKNSKYKDEPAFYQAFIKATLRLSESIKIALSKINKIDGVEVVKIFDQRIAIDYSLTKKQLEDLINEKILLTIQMSKDVVRDNSVDAIILVGGSTRIPLVRTMIEQAFPNAKIALINPDLIVAEGASIQAAIMAKNKSSFLNEILTSNLGITILGNFVSYLLYEGTPIPYEVRHRFFTTSERGKASAFLVQGKAPNMEDKSNQILGELKFDNLESRDINTPIDIKIRVSNSGIIDVYAEEGVKGGKKFYEQFQLGIFTDCQKQEYKKLRQAGLTAFKEYSHMRLTTLIEEQIKQIALLQPKTPVITWLEQELIRSQNEPISDSERKILALRAQIIIKKGMEQVA